MDLSKLKQNHDKEIFNPVSQNKQQKRWQYCHRPM